jgi:hypothetical protein
VWQWLLGVECGHLVNTCHLKTRDIIHTIKTPPATSKLYERRFPQVLFDISLPTVPFLLK